MCVCVVCVLLSHLVRVASCQLILTAQGSKFILNWQNPTPHPPPPPPPPPPHHHCTLSHSITITLTQNSSRPAEANLEPSTPDNKDDSHDSEAESTGLESDPLRSSPQLPFGSQPATAILPKIQTPTGEEGEKKIVQVRWEMGGWESGRWEPGGV